MRILRPVLVVLALLSSLLIGSTTASAAGGGESEGFTCSGGTLSPLNPSIIPPGNYESIKVTGNCLMPGGTVNVEDDVSVGRNAVLVVNVPGSPDGSMPEIDTTLNVGGDVSVGNGAALLLGCAPSFGCANYTHSVIKGNIEAEGALGMLLHSDTIMGNLSVDGGGGKNYDCIPPATGIFGVFGSPVYTTFEDGTIGKNVSFSNYKSCWLGFARTTVGGNLRYSHNILGDPDAIEILSNTINGNLSCRGNQFVDVSVTPAVYMLHNPWDSADLSTTPGKLYPRGPEPNTVNGKRSGQCVLSSPATDGGPLGPGPF